MKEDCRLQAFVARRTQAFLQRGFCDVKEVKMVWICCEGDENGEDVLLKGDGGFSTLRMV